MAMKYIRVNGKLLSLDGKLARAKMPEPPTYLTFSAPETFSIAAPTPGWNGTMEYSTDTENWNTWDGSAISGKSVYIRGSGNTQVSKSSSTAWALTGNNVSCSGNVEHLLDYSKAATGQHPEMGDACFKGWFKNCSALIVAPELPITNLTYQCYYQMFTNTGLVATPELPATVMAPSCYRYMFNGCKSLVTPSELPATTLAEGCYQYMFRECSSLTTVVSLPATTFDKTCYQQMYEGCTSIKVSETKTGTYTKAYRIPRSGDGTTATDALTDMFASTGGTFTGTPEINTTYYLDSSCSILPEPEPEPEPVNIYGVEWDWTDSGVTKGVRTDNAATFADPSPAVSNGTGSSPFDALYPWCDMVKEDRDGGVEVKEPKYWFKWTKDGKKLKLQIADGPVEGFSVDPVNMDKGDGLGELDYSYIGRYHCGSDYKSTTNVAQNVSITRSTARNGIHNLGSYFWQMDFAQMWYVNMLFLVEFADWNGECIGRGCSASGSKANNGQTDAMQYHTGTTASSRSSYGFTQYRNIEGWWDNVYDWMDGCYYNSSGLNVITNPNSFSDSANGTLVGKPSSGYPSDFTIPTASGLEWALFPSEANGSTTTYVPDYWGYSSGSPCLRRGGSYSQSQNHGPFYVSYSGTSDSNDYIGCRLQERPPKAEA